MSSPTIRSLHTLPRRSDGRVDLDRCTTALGPCDLLESTSQGWSYLVPHLGPRLLDDGVQVGWWYRGRRLVRAAEPFAELDRFGRDNGLFPTAPTPQDGRPPFEGGLVGAFAYDLARRVERLPTLARADRSAPWLSLRAAPLVVAVAPSRRQALALARPLRLTDPAGTTRWRIRRRELEDHLAAMLHALASAGPAPPLPPAPTTPRSVRSSLARDDHLDAVEQALQHIAAGDAFQVNVTRRLTVRAPHDTHQLYRALRAASAAPHGASLPDLGIASISPETFLRVDAGRVSVQPIKGTRPRDLDARVDAAHAADLQTSAKDRAENVMIVDLERNDLGRVACPGSVRVPVLCALDDHPTVWHLRSEVVAELRPGTGYGQLLRATFPCGSIAGAPKVAAMTIIDRLERVRRSWYCGAIGVLGAGHASLSVAIRTAVRNPDGTIDHGVGGGIVAGSDPHAEHRETLDKAAAFLQAMQAREAG